MIPGQTFSSRRAVGALIALALAVAGLVGLVPDGVAGATQSWATARPATFAAGVADPSPNGGLFSTACPAAGECVAVGTFRDVDGYVRAYAQTMTGGVWGDGEPFTFPAGVENADPDSYTNAVACFSVGNCTAVGSFYATSTAYDAFAVTMVDGVWGEAVPMTYPVAANYYNDLYAVDCTAVDECVAVGEYSPDSGGSRAAAAVMTGGVWGEMTPASFAGGVQISPPSAYLGSVSCAATGECTAVGRFQEANTSQQGFAQTLSGGTWGPATPSTFPGGLTPITHVNQLNAVSCTSPGECVAVGQVMADFGNQIYYGYSQVQTGGTWAEAVPVTFAAGEEQTYPWETLKSVECASAGNCTAVGYYKNAAGKIRPFGMVMTSDAWGSPTPITFPAGMTATAAEASLAWVSCPAAGECTAVGGFSGTSGSRTFTVDLDGGSWAEAVPTVFAAGVEDPSAQSFFFAVACPTTTFCSASGRFRDASGSNQGFTQDTSSGVTPGPDPGPDPEPVPAPNFTG